jgi:hypothetical protein
VFLTYRRACNGRIRLPAGAGIPMDGRAITVRISSATDGFTGQLNKEEID